MSVDLRWLLTTTAMWAPALIVAFVVWRADLGQDAHAYWLTAHRSDLYGAAPGTANAYLYSPAFAQLIWPVAQLPDAAFRTMWMIGEGAAFGWLLVPLGFRRGVPVFCMCLTEIVIANIYGFLALALVLGMRHGWPWALPLLTKITPAVGLVWFAVRREWRNLAIALIVTGVMVTVSMTINVHTWADWAQFLAGNKAARGSAVWPLRVAAGYGLTVLAARRGSAWLLAPAMLLAQPMMAHWYVGLPILAAVPRLHAYDTAHPSSRRLAHCDLAQAATA